MSPSGPVPPRRTPCRCAAVACGQRIWRHLLSSSRRSLCPSRRPFPLSVSTLWILAVTEADAAGKKNKRERKRSHARRRKKKKAIPSHGWNGMEALGALTSGHTIQHTGREKRSAWHAMPCTPRSSRPVLARVAVTPEPVAVGVHSISFPPCLSLCIPSS